MSINVFLLLFFYLLAKYSKNINSLTPNIYYLLLFYDKYQINRGVKNLYKIQRLQFYMRCCCFCIIRRKIVIATYFRNSYS